MGVYRPVTLTGGVVQPFNIKDMDMATPVADQPCLLQFTGYEGDAAALHPQHLR